MKKRKLILPIFVIVLLAGLSVVLSKTALFAEQEVSFIHGVVSNADPEGDSIEIETDAGGKMTFSVPDDANITGMEKKIGLMDIGVGDVVDIRYYSSSPDKHVVVSIVDDDPTF